MSPDRIIHYDDEFIAKFDRLKTLLEAGDDSVLYRFLIDEFGVIFRTFQYFAKKSADGSLREFEEADEETKRELMRPLSFRQYRLVEGSFSRWREEEEQVIWSIWDFLHDDGRIYEKTVMSSSEMSGASIILENVYVCLSGRERRNS